MVIIGAGNLGKHILDQLIDEDYREEIVFYDDNAGNEKNIFDRFKIINNIESLKEYFQKHDNKFISAIGHPRIRKKVTEKIQQIGGELASIISKHARISSFSQIGPGAVIQPGCCVSHNTIIGTSCILHANTLIGHDVKIGDYFSCGSNANILSPATIGHFCVMGANSLFMPGKVLGDHVIVSAGQVVRQDYIDNTTVSGF